MTTDQATTGTTDSQSVIQRQIAAAIERIGRLLSAHLDGDGASEWHDDALADSVGAGPAQDIADLFGLTRFESDLLMLCAAVELDGGIAAAVSRALDTRDPRPTFGLALACLPHAHWDALQPEAPLRSWRLVNVSDSGTLTSRRASIDERVLHHLLGLPARDPRLDGMVIAFPPSGPMFRSHENAATEFARSVVNARRQVIVNLRANDEATGRAFAMHVSDTLGAVPVGVVAPALPRPGLTLHDLTRLLDREWLLSRSLPVVFGIEDQEPAVGVLAETSLTPVIITINAPPKTCTSVSSRVVLNHTVPAPSPAEQRSLLRHAINGAADPDLMSAVDDVAHRHSLTSESIAAIGLEMNQPDGEASPSQRLHTLCRERSRTRLDNLAQRIASRAGWSDIVLPTGHLDRLRDITRQVRHRFTVYDEWGFADRTSRGLGVTALFAGESGTGKTLAAEIIANELSLDLYRVDLAATVSKYIGETEKNLSRLFDAAEGSGAVLLFDEADALFGKRTEIRDSHDRYANLEVAYLLQRMESYRGLAILTTNLRSNLDRAFVRRLRFIMQFPFPDEEQRAEIWRKAFPPQTPLENVEPESLAKLTIPGGSIWSIALSAAFAAAEAGTAITPAHLVQAARTEYAKNDRSLTMTEMAALR
jgi:vesicle-fusing ATPase